MKLNQPIQGKHILWCKLLVVALAAGGIYLTSTAEKATAAAPSSQLAGITKTVEPANVQVYAPKAKAKLDLPKEVQSNERQQVIAATDLPASKRERTVSTVLDLDSGEAIQYVQEKELPWLGKANDTRFGLYAGVKQTPYGTEPAIRAQVSHDLFAVKEATVVLHGAIDATNSGRVDAFVGVGVEF